MQSFHAATCCRVPSIIAAAALSGLSTAAHAQWTVTNLNPAGSIQAYAFAAGGGQQAGWVVVGGMGRASLWSGTAASWVDLAPVGASSSAVNAVGGGQQVGVAYFGGRARAGLWSGTASSWVDLSSFLPVGFTDTYATGISSDGVNIFISGYGTNATGVQALLWTQPIPGPGAVALLGLGGLLTTRRRR